MRHVDPELRANLVGDGTEGLEVELAGVGGPSGDENLRANLEGLGTNNVHVDTERLRVDPVGVCLVELAREVELHPVGEVSTVGELEAEDLVAGLRDCGEDGGVGGCSRVRLHVGVCGAEQCLGAAEREGLGDVDELAATVVTAARVTLGVLVGEDGALRFEHGARNEVLARDHLEGAALAAELAVKNSGNFGINLGQRGIEC